MRIFVKYVFLGHTENKFFFKMSSHDAFCLRAAALQWALGMFAIVQCSTIPGPFSSMFFGPVVAVTSTPSPHPLLLFSCGSSIVAAPCPQSKPHAAAPAKDVSVLQALPGESMRRFFHVLFRLSLAVH
jgi:hypothetical protein